VKRTAIEENAKMLCKGKANWGGKGKEGSWKKKGKRGRNERHGETEEKGGGLRGGPRGGSTKGGKNGAGEGAKKTKEKKSKRSCSEGKRGITRSEESLSKGRGEFNMDVSPVLVRNKREREMRNERDCSSAGDRGGGGSCQW